MTNRKPVRLGIAGLGTVAQGVLRILTGNAALIAERTGLDITVAHVASRTPRPEVDLLGASFGTDLAQLTTADDVDIVLELIGGEHAARDLIDATLTAGKPVVTANKAVIARFGNELFAEHPAGALAFEAAVAGAIPIIQAMREALVANRFRQVVGIINGTCNYILTAMQVDGQSFDAALADAQRLGYAEADPGFDIEGVDAAHKLTILAALAFGVPFSFDALHVEGITEVTAEDIAYAQELGYRIKHIGIAKQTDAGIEARVHPALVPAQKLLAHVNDVANAVVVDADAAGQTLFSGPGAGSLATASAVLADVVALAQGQPLSPPQPADRSAVAPFLPIDTVECPHYLRIAAQDEPGAFAQVANALSTHGISIEAAIQKEPGPGQKIVPIVILTQAVSEAAVQAAMAEVEKLPQVHGAIARIRVEML